MRDPLSAGSKFSEKLNTLIGVVPDEMSGVNKSLMKIMTVFLNTVLNKSSQYL